MAARKIFGEAPPATGAVLNGLWLVGEVDDAVDATKLLLSVYAFQPPNAVEWGDGARTETPPAAATAPTATTPGRWNLTHAYAKPLAVSGYVEANGARARFRTANFQKLPVGPSAQTLRERQERMADDARLAGSGQALPNLANSGMVNR